MSQLGPFLYSGRGALDAPSGPPPVWVPTDLAGLAPTLVVALQRSGGNLWQDAIKTVPAVAAHDPVRVATCPFTGVDYTAPSDSARPLLENTSGALWGQVFDGTDDVLICPQSSLTDAVADTNTVGFSAAYTFATPGDNYMACRGNSANAAIAWGTDGTGSFPRSTTYSSGLFSGSVTRDALPHTIVHRRAGANTDSCRLDGSNAPGIVVASITVTAGGSVGITVGAAGGPILFSPCTIYGLLPYGGFSYSGGNLTNIETYLTALHP